MVFFRYLLVALTFFVATAPAAKAQTFNVNVGGTDYVVVGLGVGQSFDSNAAAITSSPWWGDAALAAAIRTAVRAISGPTAASSFYAFEDGANSTVFNLFLQTRVGSIFGSDQATDATNISKSATDFFGEPFQLFAGSIDVPELDAPALLQALFVLFAFGFWLRARPRST